MNHIRSGPRHNAGHTYRIDMHNDFITRPYVYQDPCSKGYKRTPITLSDLKRIGLGARRSSLFGAVAVYWHEQDDTYHIQYLTSITGKALLTLVLPFAVLGYGVMNIKEVLGDYRRRIFERKYGSFSTDTVFPRDRSHALIKELHRSQGMH